MKSWRQVILSWLLFASLAGGMQIASGVYDGSWGNDPDEPSHFLNGVMLFDYIASGVPETPLVYAQAYYDHYPKIGLGHWPPFFAIVEAAWFLFTPISYRSGMVLIALLTASVATILTVEAARRLPLWLAISGGVIWMALPEVRRSGDVFMAEMLITLCTLAALRALGDFLESAAARDSLSFALWSILALLTKGTGIALALTPPLAILLARRWSLVRTRALWIAPVGVLLAAGPWYALAPGALHERVAPYGGIRYIEGRAGQSLSALYDDLGALLAGLAIIGLALIIVRAGIDPRWTVFIAALLANLTLRSVVASWEPRHLIVLTPGLILLALAGYQWLECRCPWRPIARLLVVAAVLLHVRVNWPPRDSLPGFDEAAGLFMKSNGSETPALVAGGAPAEGAFICEVAVRDHRPGRTVLRASKFLARSDFLGRNYELLYNTPEELDAVLRKAQINTVVIELPGTDARPHLTLLAAYLRGNPQQWQLAGVFHDKAAVYTRTM